MKKGFKLFSINVLIAVCYGGGQPFALITTQTDVSSFMAQIATEEKAGNFTQAALLIDQYIAEHETVLSTETIDKLLWQKEKMRRITLDFNKDRESVVRYIRKYIPEVDDSRLHIWEDEKSLEYCIIDGKKRYFARAAANLFRINKKAAARKEAVEAQSVNYKEKTLTTHLPAVVDAVKKTGNTQAAPVRMKVKYTVTLKPDAVPSGETVRCWLPYPREDNRRQTDVRLLYVNGNDYILSPVDHAHRTLYMEKTAQKNQALTFTVEFSYRSVAEWFHLDAHNVAPYNTNSDLYRIYTSERPPHIIFNDSIKAISKRIVGNEKDVFRKLQKIFVWINETFPWAGAREYSTIDNIPQYVLENRHGDCGQVTLLFIALARYNGIPARWQSGFMMHPQAHNLHDWSEFYIEGKGWIPMDQSFGINRFVDRMSARNRPLSENDKKAVKYFYTNGIDAYRWIVNNDYSQPLFPKKNFPRSETVDFQRGELEWREGNIYFDQWDWKLEINYIR